MAERFTVWAPGKQRVRLRYSRDGRVRDHEMGPEVTGWWRVELDDAETTARGEHERGGVGPVDYAYLLDEDPTELPDPRSAWQPFGVHGRSRRYDHDAFGWTDATWHGRALPGSVLYELHIGTFTPAGSLDSAIERLDHLVELGIDLVEVLPVNTFDGIAGWGYDGVAWGAVHEPYGGPDGFKRFVDACHARGIGVLLDVVYNHLGPSGAYLDRFGPYFAGRNIWGPTVNLDGPDSDDVRRYIIDNAVGWLRDFHVDGLRLDAVHALVDHRAKHLLEELAEEVDALAANLGRPLSLIAESDLNDPRLITPRQAGGFGLAAQWSDDLHHALHCRITGESQGYYADFAVPQALPTVLRSAFFHAGTYSTFRKRTHGRAVDTARTPGHRFLAYTQNHDQIGNRAWGDRLAANVSPGLLGIAAALVLCGPYTPMIFMGEEWAASTPWQFFSSFTDPALARAVADGRLEEFAEHGWGAAEVADPLDPATVARSTLDWPELVRAPHRDMLKLYRTLIALRRARPELTDPRLDLLSVRAEDDWLVLHRGNLRVACNFGAECALVPLEMPAGTPATMLLDWGRAALAGRAVELAGESFAILGPAQAPVAGRG